ncbi:hypothetical protein [Arthrobacter glacialis]|uniref:hypothetical protein n=1 Tax=Arthrobacter glacialis TaxID=1664 RepID=UPI0010571ACA|nr:hypothetical protein [Arthrobacter glacialis]
MSPEKRPVVTYRERGRFSALIMGIIAIAMLIAGIYFGVTEGKWLVLLIAAGVTILVVFFYFHNEKVHRGDP